jgi:hypothetical protein
MGYVSFPGKKRKRNEYRAMGSIESSFFWPGKRGIPAGIHGNLAQDDSLDMKSKSFWFLF